MREESGCMNELVDTFNENRPQQIEMAGEVFDCLKGKKFNPQV